MFKLIFLFLFIATSLMGCSTGQRENSEYDFDKSLNDIKEEKIKIVEEKKVLVNKAEQYGLDQIKAFNLNVVDFNQDGYSDIVVIPSFFSQPEFYQFNIEKRIFVKTKSLFDSSLKASYLLFYDINNDKILDAIVGVLNQKTEMSKEPFRIFLGSIKNKKLKLTQSSSAFKATPNSSVGLIDYNLDGKLDIFLGNWFSRANDMPIPHKDQLFLNQGENFKDITAKLVDEEKQNPDKAMYINARPTYGVQICDIDQNGFPDILTTSTNFYLNKLWLNKYRFREDFRYFEDIALTSGYGADREGLINNQGGGRTFSLACADYNNDRIYDVFLGELTHNYDNEGIDKSSILTGRTFKKNPRFFRTEYTQDSFDPNWHQADRRAIWVDFNNDGLLDLLVDNSGYPPYTKLILFEQNSDHSFTDKSNEYGINIINPMSSVILDINRDGKMDILTSQSNIRDESITPGLYLFENNIQTKNKSLRFYLRGELSNYHGLNATVILKVKKDDKFTYKTQNVSYSYGALPPQNEEGIHFGIHESEEIVYVKVVWPYAKSLNSNRAQMEKIYYIKNDFEDYLNITLCESGDYLIGRRECAEN